MRLLLDTHILLWWLTDDPLLPTAARGAITDRQSAVYVSTATVWEIAIKRSLGRLDFPLDEMEGILADEGFNPLPIAVAHAARAGSLPAIHRDPFDRMLVAQAQVEGLTVVSVDSMVRRYAVAILDGNAC